VVGRTRRLKCPKCGAVFDYEFVPGASFTAVRLGTSRYMRCPVCLRFSVFPMTGPEPPESVSSAAGAAARYSDSRSTARWALLVIVPFLVLIFLAAFGLGRPEPSLAVVIGLVIAMLVVLGLVLFLGRPAPVPTAP
jgi:hypothetical protein